MPQKLRLAASQSRTLETIPETLRSLENATRAAARDGVDLILFPEAFLGGYPRTCNFGCAVGAREPRGREQFLKYFHSAVDLGDTPAHSGDDWVNKKLPLPKDGGVRGDGTREELERIARETGVFIVTGVVERSGGSLYCGVVYVCPKLGAVGKRRKVMPTGTERLIWAQGSPETLRAITTTIKGVRLTLAAAICWENLMPMLRQSLYSQNVNLFLAPTADPRPTWGPLMQTIGCEGRAFVLSANQCITRKNLPAWIRHGDSLNSLATSTARPPSATHHRQRSTTFRTTGAPLTRRMSEVRQTEDGHEICWPLSPSRSKPGATPLEDEVAVPNGEALASPAHKPHDATNGVVITHPDDAQHELVMPPLPEQSVADVVAGGAGDGVAADNVDKARPATATSEDASDDEFLSRGGSCIVSPFGEFLAGPLWEVEDGGLLVVDADFEDCERGRLDLDVAGHYSRGDAFRLTVQGLDISPPP